MNPIATTPMRWHQDLTGQVFDPASLNMFWFELTAGAYGLIHHVGAIVEVVDGSAWRLSFESGTEPVETELPGARWRMGRPTRPSQIEVVGEALDPIAMAESLGACALSDAILENYQAQLRRQG
jgi:hypothetical protein